MITRFNWTRAAVMAGALLVLGSLAAWLEYGYRPRKEAEEEASKKLFSLKDQPVRSVALSDGAGHVFELRCQDATPKLCKPGDNSRWELARPKKSKADDGNGNSLLSALNNLSLSETIDLKDETPEKRQALLKEYGLDAPSRAQASTRKIEVVTEKGKSTLFLGIPHPLGGTIFSLVEHGPADGEGKADENKVYLVPNYFSANFDHDLNYWRDKKLMSLTAHEIESFKLSTARADLTATRKDGAWTLKTPKGESFTGDLENIDSLLTGATYLMAKKFVSDDKASKEAVAALKGFRTILHLTLQAEKGSGAQPPAPVTLLLHQKGTGSDGKIYATVSNLDPLYELETAVLPRLDRELKDLRMQKLITSMERFTTRKIEFAGKPLGGEPLVLKSQDGKWSVEGEKSETDGDKVQNLLDRFSGNRIQQFLKGGAIPSGESDGITVKLFNEKGEPQRQLAFWKNGGKLYARDARGGAEAFLVDSVLVSDLPWARDAFAKKAAPAAPAGAPAAAQAPAGAPPDPDQPLIPIPPAGKEK